MIFCTISASFFACISWKENDFLCYFFWKPFFVWLSFFKTLLSPSISFFDFNRPSSPRILGWNMFSSLKRSTRRCLCYCGLPWSMSVCHVAFITLLAFEEYFALFTSKQANIVHLQKSRYRDTIADILLSSPCTCGDTNASSTAWPLHRACRCTCRCRWWRSPRWRCSPPAPLALQWSARRLYLGQEQGSQGWSRFTNKPQEILTEIGSRKGIIVRAGAPESKRESWISTLSGPAPRRGSSCSRPGSSLTWGERVKV